MALSYATAYQGLESEPAIFETAVRTLAEGNFIRSTRRILQTDKDAVCDWLNRAALHCRSVELFFEPIACHGVPSGQIMGLCSG